MTKWNAEWNPGTEKTFDLKKKTKTKASWVKHGLIKNTSILVCEW